MIKELHVKIVHLLHLKIRLAVEDGAQPSGGGHVEDVIATVDVAAEGKQLKVVMPVLQTVQV